MKYIYEINDKQKAFKNLLLDIQSYFSNNTNTIHKARNELKIINFNHTDTIVKSFKVPNIFRRIYYTYFRDSKAKKSYNYSVKIGKFTPEPIGYIEFFEDNFLADSYFIAKKFDYDFTIREPLLDDAFEDKETVFKEFAKFTHALHEKQILHKDYSPGNILIKKENGSYIFKIVDINRMEFRELSMDDRLKNFSMLWAKDRDLEIIIKEYAKIAGLHEEDAIKRALYFSQKLKDFKNMKKRLKGKPVVD